MINAVRPDSVFHESYTTLRRTPRLALASSMVIRVADDPHLTSKTPRDVDGGAVERGAKRSVTAGRMTDSDVHRSETIDLCGG